MMKAIAGIIFFLLACLPFQGQGQVAVRLEADSTYVETGNPYELHLIVSGEKNPDSLNLEPWQAFVSPKNLLSLSDWKRSGNRLVCEISLLFFEADTISLPPLAIVFENSDTLYTASFNLIIYPTPSPDDLNDMAPIKDIRREPVFWTDYIPMAAAVVGVLALFGLLFWWYSREKKQAALQRIIELPPHELALKKLIVLQKKSLWAQGDVKGYCAELTFIIREYLEKRYHILALESTSEELLLEMKKIDFPADLKPDLENILSQADLAKFAKAIPPDEFYLYSMDFAQAMVNRTIAPTQEETSGESL